MKKFSEYDQKIPQSHTAGQLMAPWGRATRYQEDKHSKTTSSLTQSRLESNLQQKMEQTQNPTMGATINNESTTTEPLP